LFTVLDAYNNIRSPNLLPVNPVRMLDLDVCHTALPVQNRSRLPALRLPPDTTRGSSINDVTRFGSKTDSPSSLCHISSQISEPPSKMTSHAHDPPPGKVMTIIVRASGSLQVYMIGLQSIGLMHQFHSQHCRHPAVDCRVVIPAMIITDSTHLPLASI